MWRIKILAWQYSAVVDEHFTDDLIYNDTVRSKCNVKKFVELLVAPQERLYVKSITYRINLFLAHNNLTFSSWKMFYWFYSFL